MQLRDYLAETGLTLDDVAKMTSPNTPQNVSRHANGTRIPDLEMIDRYRKMTGGRVDWTDWRDLEIDQKAKRRTSDDSGMARTPAPAGGERSPAHV